MDKNIVCPMCKGEFSGLKCNDCGYEARQVCDVTVFPSNLVSTFDGYSLHTGLEQYASHEPNKASDYYPRYIDGNIDIVLDIGGGDGMALANFAKNNKNTNVYVVDADIKNLSKVSKRGISNLKSLNCSATNLPFKDNSVDVVFTLFMVEHMYDYQYSDFLFEAKRVLKDGGKLIVATDSDFYDKWIHPLQRLFSLKDKFKSSKFLEKYDCNKIAIDHHNLKSPYQTRDFIKRHGFFVQDIRLHLIAGRRILGALAYEIFIPKIFAQKFLSTMFIVVARKI